MAARLSSDIWVGAYMARLQAEGIFAHIVHKGDDRAGAIAIKLATMDGKAALYLRRYDMDGESFWEEAVALSPEADADTAISTQRNFDRDLWVIEVEDPRGRHMLDAPGIG